MFSNFQRARVFLEHGVQCLFWSPPNWNRGSAPATQTIFGGVCPVGFAGDIWRSCRVFPEVNRCSEILFKWPKLDSNCSQISMMVVSIQKALIEGTLATLPPRAHMIWNKHSNYSDKFICFSAIKWAPLELKLHKFVRTLCVLTNSSYEKGFTPAFSTATLCRYFKTVELLTRVFQFRDPKIVF